MIEHIIKYENYDTIGDFDFQFGNVEFKVDFGPWKKGQKVDFLCMLDQGVMAEYTADGKEVRTCEIKIVPK